MKRIIGSLGGEREWMSEAWEETLKRTVDNLRREGAEINYEKTYT